MCSGDVPQLEGIQHVMAKAAPFSNSGYPPSEEAAPLSFAPQREEAADDVGAASSASAPHSAEVSTIALSISDTGSERSVGSDRGVHVEVINWDELRLGHRLQPYRRYAHCREDVYLLSAFLELGELRDIDGDSVKLLLRALKLLHLCDYSSEDLCSFLAHASAYFASAYGLCGMHMDECEIGNVLVLLIFIAHCYVQDETCPLHVWHQYLFRKYCPLRTLNAAILRLLEIRQYILRLESQDLDQRFAYLQHAVRKPREREHMFLGSEPAKVHRQQAILSKVRGIKKYR